MRLSFAKKMAPSSSEASSSSFSSSIQNPHTSTSRDILLFHTEQDDQTVTEQRLMDDHSSYSDRSSTSTTHKQGENQSSKNKNRKKYYKATSSFTKILCFSDQAKKRQFEKGDESEYREDRMDNRNGTSLSTTTTSPESGIIEYHPTYDQRQDDDEYCLDGYRYLHAKELISQQRQLTVEGQEREHAPSVASSLENSTSTLYMQSDLLPWPANQCEDQVTAAPVSQAAIATNKDVVDGATYNNQGTVVSSTTTLSSPKSIPSPQPKEKKSSIPILPLGDTMINPAIRSMARAALVEGMEVEAIDTNNLFQNLVVRPTWTTDDTTVRVDDPKTIRHRSGPMENATNSVGSSPTAESMFRETCQQLTQSGRSVWNNFLLVPSTTTLQQQAKLLQLLTPLTAKSKGDHKEVGQSVWDKFLLVPSAPTLRQRAKLLQLHPKKQGDHNEVDKERNVGSQTMGTPDAANKGKAHAHVTAVQSDNPSHHVDSNNENTATITTNIQRKGVSASVSFAAIDLPYHHHLDNTRNEIAWHRCMARKGARLLNSAGDKFYKKLRRKSALKNRNELYKPCQDTNHQASSTVTKIVQEEEVEEAVKTIENIDRLSPFTFFMKSDEYSTIPLLPLCEGPYKNCSKHDPNTDDDNDDDSFISIPVNTRLERTRSPLPLFKRQPMIDSFSSQDEEEDGTRYTADSIDPKSWLHYIFPRKEQENGGDGGGSESPVADSSFEEDGTHIDSCGNGSDAVDDDDLDDLDELLYQAQQLGRSLSHLFETTQKGKQQNSSNHQIVIPIIVHQQPDILLNSMNATKIQSDD
ncbi:hypothetical protein IV203_014147 [Nitzschia inconspicua]|uniref:Uncharacterized protein n=1 Tax=Nitzschia inconspicua TaxID=303405 RepID=A0A9K3M6S2_9STRA|nr:hypothetical protein IV203_014147 [Nitzschia inconspicua]